jgi:hypothetical protein
MTIISEEGGGEKRRKRNKKPHIYAGVKSNGGFLSFLRILANVKSVFNTCKP